MANEVSKNNFFAVAMLVSSVILSAALVFIGLQMGKSNLSPDEIKTSVVDGIKAYVDQQNGGGSPEQNVVAKIEKDLTDDDAVLGNKNAPLTIVEFSDYQCPVCRYFHKEYFPILKEKFIDTGKVKLVFRDLPLTSLHPDAFQAAVAVECARKQKGDAAYYEMQEKVFAGQEKDNPEGVAKITKERLLGYAAELNLDEATFSACLEDPDMNDEILGDMQDATDNGIDATPTFVVGETVLRGLPRTVEGFEQLIEEQLSNL